MKESTAIRTIVDFLEKMERLKFINQDLTRKAITDTMKTCGKKGHQEIQKGGKGKALIPRV